jgi:hypothetical protein
LLPRTVVIELASVLGLKDDAFIVGGQAFNLWAERYAKADPELVEFGPFTSKDLDYFGYAAAAQKLAQALNGVVKVPSLDDATPNSAIVEANIAGTWVEIDFITDVVGVRVDPLRKWAVELAVPLKTDEGRDGLLVIPVMHPLHCFQSRIANVVKLGRKDDTAMRQVHAAPIVLAHYLEEQLRNGDHKEVQETLAGLTHHLAGTPEGRAAHSVCQTDPLDILRRLTEDTRLDVRYRRFNIQWMLRKVQSGRILRGLKVLS